MYLFRTVDNAVEVYELTPKYDEIRAYKSEMLDSIPEGKRFMEHTTTRDKLYSRDGIVHCGGFNKDNEKDLIGLGFSDMFSYQSESEYTEELRKRFINNHTEGLEAFKLYKVIGNNSKKEEGRLYLLVTEYYDNPYKKAVLHNIMVLPKSLFIIRSLETGRLDLIEDEDITNELKYFDIEFVKSITWDNITDLAKYGLIDNAINEAKEKVDDTSKFLELKLKNK